MHAQIEELNEREMALSHQVDLLQDQIKSYKSKIQTIKRVKTQLEKLGETISEQLDIPNQ